MHLYLDQIEFAVTSLLGIAVKEGAQLTTLETQIARKKRLHEILQQDFESSDLSEDFSPEQVMGKFALAAKTGLELRQLEGQSLEAAYLAHEEAIQAIAGAVLQIAKQGLSTVYGKKSSVPEGRRIGNCCIRDIIWEGRNQSQHHEEKIEDNKKSRDAEWRKLFAALETNHGEQFSLSMHEGQSRAIQVLQLLDWDSFTAFARDMRSLVPPPNA